MTSSPIPDPPGKVLAMLDDDPPMPEHYTPGVIERLPLDDITARLGELGVHLAMPDLVRELIESECGPAEHLIWLLDNEENTDLAEVPLCQGSCPAPRDDLSFSEGGTEG